MKDIIHKKDNDYGDWITHKFILSAKSKCGLYLLRRISPEIKLKYNKSWKGVTCKNCLKSKTNKK